MKMKWIYSLLILTCLVSLRISDPWIVEALRLKAMDSYQRNQKTEISSGTVVLNIDEKALDKYGQWPLPRSEYSYIIQELYKRNAGLVILDVLMPERDRFGEDAILAKTITKYPVILANIPAEKTKNKRRNQ